MDSPKAGKGKKGIISKTWARCKSFSGRKGSSGGHDLLTVKSRSCPRGLVLNVQLANQKPKKWSRVAPDGCFSIYVGPERQRFVIKTEYVNHPLFRVLLEEAESEYGYSSDGPLVLPCAVDRFMTVLMEMDSEELGWSLAGCNFSARSYSSYHLLTPAWLIVG